MAFTYDPYQKGQRLTDLEEEQNRVLGSKPAAWDREKNYAPVQLALDAYKNRGKFSYDITTDALYNQYTDQYVNQGKQAMMDVMGQASAMTGGYGNSYAQTVGQQTYQGYLQGLNDKVPELYQLALDKYNQEGADLLNAYGLEKDKYDTGYGEWQDATSLWNADRDYITGAVQSERDYDYGRYSDEYNRALSKFNSDQDERIAGLETSNKELQKLHDSIIVDENGDPVSVNGKAVEEKKPGWNERKWTLVDDGGGRIGAINDNAVANDGYRNYTMKQLYQILLGEGWTRSDAKEYIKKLQESVGIN